MKILFIGDVVGSPGREAIKRLVPGLRRRLGLDWVVANGENAAGGAGITRATAQEIWEGQVDLITLGDHVWDQKEVVELFRENLPIIRPINYPEGVPGTASWILSHSSGAKLAVVNAQGRTFMASLENPFRMVQAEVERLKRETPLIFLDFHAEATSEKIAMGRFLDGQVSAVVGTHTHVQTADERIFPGGTGFLCDAGFTGAQDSVIGREIEPIIARFLDYQPRRCQVSKENIVLHGIWFELDDRTGKTLSLGRIQEPLVES